MFQKRTDGSISQFRILLYKPFNTQLEWCVFIEMTAKTFLTQFDNTSKTYLLPKCTSSQREMRATLEDKKHAEHDHRRARTSKSPRMPDPLRGLGIGPSYIGMFMVGVHCYLLT